MSEATSLLGTIYAQHFRDGFLLINEDRMRDNQWLYSDTKIYRKGVTPAQEAGDVDAGCVITKDTKLSDLLFLSSSVITDDVIIPAGTLFLVEATNRTDRDLIPSTSSSSSKVCYIDKKIQFHFDLLNGNVAFNTPPNITGYYLLLIYNGAEHQPTFQYMKQQLKNNNLNGSAVWCGNDKMNEWPTKIQLERTEEKLKKAEEKAEKAEEKAKEALKELEKLKEQIAQQSSKK